MNVFHSTPCRCAFPNAPGRHHVPPLGSSALVLATLDCNQCLYIDRQLSLSRFSLQVALLVSLQISSPLFPFLFSTGGGSELYSYSPYKATRRIFGEVKCISDINKEAFTITEVLCIFSLRSNGSWDSSAAGFIWDTITIA